MLGSARWRSPAIFGLILCVSGVVGLWGVGFFSNSLVGPAIAKSLEGKGLTDVQITQQKQWWSAANLIVQNLGAFAGMLMFTRLCQWIGRKPAFAIGFIGAMAATIFFYRNFQTREDVWMSAVMGFFQLALFAGFAIYLPELFPTRLRSTGTSFCYNVGRFIAATGPFTLGNLQVYLGSVAVKALGDVPTEAAKNAAKLEAFRDAACWLSAIYLVGLLVLPFLPETKDQPLPED